MLGFSIVRNKELNEVLKASKTVNSVMRPGVEFLEGLSSEGVKVPLYAIPMDMMYQLVEYSDILRTILFSLNKEIFRNKFEIKPKFVSKCINETCGKEFQDEVDLCDQCGGDVRKPDFSEEILIRKLIDEDINENNQNLLEVMSQMENDVNVVDDMYLMMLKDYVFDSGGKIVSWAIKEIIRGNPLFLGMIADKKGLPGRDERGDIIATCPEHRDRVYNLKENTKCPVCGKVLYKAFYVSRTSGVTESEKKIYYIEGEIAHASKYMPSLLYGFPPILSVWMKATTLMNMDKYMKDYYLRTRPPKSLFLVNTKNAEDLKRSWEWVLEKTKLNPHSIHPLAVESNSDRGQVAQFINFMQSLEEMQYIETRNEMRRTIGSLYGVMPIFHSDTSQSGGLNNEGMQISVTNRSVQIGQEIHNEKILKFILKQYNIDDYTLKLKEPEMTDQMRELQIEAQKIANAVSMVQMGFDVEMEHGGEFKFSKLPQELIPAQTPKKPIQEEITGRFEGEPKMESKSETKRKMELSYLLNKFGFSAPTRIDSGDKEFNLSSLVDKAIDDVEKELNINIYREKAAKGNIHSAIKRSLFRRRFSDLSKPQSDRVRRVLTSAFESGEHTMLGVVRKLMAISKEISRFQAEMIVRTEQSAVYNTARELSYKEADPQDKMLYKWIGPTDARTTDICKNIKSRSMKGVSMEELKKIVKDESRKADANWAVRDWVPHANCRHSFVRYFK